MLKKKITYVDPFSGEIVEEEHYFNFTKAELVEMKFGYAGGSGLDKYLARIAEEGNPAKIMDAFKDIIAKAYGERVNNRFMKSPEISQAFLSSEAYSTLFMEIVEGGEQAMIRFIQAIVPNELLQQSQPKTVELPKENVPTFTQPAASNVVPLPSKKNLAEYSQEELTNMPADEFRKLFNK